MEMIFSDLRKKIKPFWQSTISKIRLSHITANYFSYNDITLKRFIQVMETGNFRLLIKSGKATLSACVDQWEKIVNENNKALGRHEYNALLKTYKAYNRLLNDYTAIKSHLLILCYCVDHEAIKFVRSKGYKIDTTNSTKYAESLTAAIRRSDNIITRLQMKRNELMMMQPGGGETKKESFETIIAALSFELGYTLPDDLTLCRYNEYLKLIERRNKQLKAAREKQSYGRT